MNSDPRAMLAAGARAGHGAAHMSPGTWGTYAADAVHRVVRAARGRPAALDRLDLGLVARRRLEEHGAMASR